MLTPTDAAGLVLAYHCADPQQAAEVTLAAINAAGFAVVKRDEYMGLVERCARADEIALLLEVAKL